MRSWTSSSRRAGPVSLSEELAALRGSVAYSRLDHVSYVRVRGDDAYRALDGLFPAALRLRDGQMLHTMLLTEDAAPFADAYLCWDDEEFLILAEGPTSAELVAHLRAHLPANGVEVEDLSATHAIFALDGPYAWELLGLVVDPEAIGLPYLTFYHAGDWICYRAGKTGEYGYGIIVSQEEVEELENRITAAGQAFDLQRASLAALDQCALENWFFNVRGEGREPVTPIELQLQWRVSYGKEYPGSAALARRRADGAKERLTTLLSPDEMRAGDLVQLGRRRVGHVVNAGFSHARGEWISTALIDVAWAHPGVASFTVTAADRSTAARSVSPPVLNNRSLSISPQLHSYATRHEHALPDLVRQRT